MFSQRYFYFKNTLASAQLMLFSPTRIELNNNVQVLAMPQEFEEDFDDPLLEV